MILKKFYSIPIILILSVLGFSATIEVPGHYPTIQEAIDAAVNGDHILQVYPGTYTENIQIYQKEIFINSLDGPDSTLIDGNQLDMVVKIYSPGLKPVLEGFTITNGKAKEGAGIHCRADSIIRDNIITGNNAHDQFGSAGAGIYCYGNAPKIIGNIITENIATSFQGSSVGGGIICWMGSTALIERNTISFNDAMGGGGIYCKYSLPVIIGNTFIGNKAVEGAGIRCFDRADVLIANNLFHGNKASGLGGGVSTAESSPYLTNNTFVENDASIAGGAFYSTGPVASPVIVNSILWNDNANTGSEIWIGGISNPSSLFIYYSDVKGGKNSIHIESGSTLTWGPGMIETDPLFADQVEADFHIPFNSPCRDSGTNITLFQPTEDFEGDPRKEYGKVDIGADEFHTHLYHVGKPTPGGMIEVKFVGLPGTVPLHLFIGSGVLDNPVPTIWGDWWLVYPVRLLGDLGPIPPEGIHTITGTLPVSVPRLFPMQALVGNELTNLSAVSLK